MTFSSLVFICIFLPVTFLLHSAIPNLRFRNALLILSSLFFYAYGEPVYVILLLISVLLNYSIVLLMTGPRKRLMLILAVVVNIGILFTFKYLAFLIDSVNDLFGTKLTVPEISLPIGISFFTFQAMSYVIDVYRGEAEREKNFFRVLLYISFFPQLIAGPIVKYRDIAAQLRERTVTVEEAAPGLRRFIFGLSKKVFIANSMAVVVDAIFKSDLGNVNLLTAWIGAVAYMLQIYFDFSGYSDMAIGMGRMFGFKFKENFDAPYTSVNIKEFWRRWHISLSTWFKEYVYIPLGGNRKGKVRTGVNKLLVFFLCGLWHGANWTFVVWGLFHGAFSFLEEAVSGIRKLPRILGHIYAMLIVCVGFVIFRADTIGSAFDMIGRMFTGFDFSAASMSFTLQQLTPFFIVMLVIGILLAGPGEKLVKKARESAGDEKQPEIHDTFEKNAEHGETGGDISESEPVVIHENKSKSGNGSVETDDKARRAGKKNVLQVVLYVVAFVMLLWCMIRLSSGSYNPFIYFRF